MKYLGHPFLTALLAGLMQLIAMKCSYTYLGTDVAFFIAWAGFAAWACYFLAGCTPKGGLKVIGCWAGGVIGSIAIIELGLKLCGTMDPLAAFPIAVFIIAFFVVCFEKVQALNMIPAWFVGAACFFAYHSMISGALTAAKATSMQIHLVAGSAILVSCVVGQIFGVVTVTIRGKYAQLVEGAGKTASIEGEPETA